MSGCRPTIVWVVKARERQTTLLFVRLYRRIGLTLVSVSFGLSV